MSHEPQEPDQTEQEPQQPVEPGAEEIPPETGTANPQTVQEDERGGNR